MNNIIGNLLIAPPSVKGNFWYKTVIMLTEHHQDGSVGLVLNKRSQMSVPEFGEQLGIDIDLPGFIYLGGPLNVKSLSFLHTNEWRSTNTMRINSEFSLSSAEDIIPRLALGDTPKQWRIFLGMCGWSPGQLESEIKGTPPYDHSVSWCTANSDLDLVFGSDNKDQWCNALDRSGQEFAQNILM
ncbi:COG1678 Putative transcriptional regulator [uncultured Caudovirales phage]|uniref:COG1678 Putative transcriptional regulator n=1 Tax=uncultured Caudovirales phage TaxID=2100421 RepID=A0A6J7WKK4_9CAUD|nr:COG1678 Putative transcriptional regulator [uncultured Caudovirales phage]CAB5208505.1 COG1678 Putative transcriptional regulator [uncultured Caudovirales phage]